MLPLKEFAHFVILNTADLAETYIQLLQNTGQGYEQISADSCRVSARKLLEAVAEACQAETFTPLSQLFDPDKETSQRWAGIQLLPRQALFEVECLGQTLTPVVTSLEAGKFLWQMLAEVRAVVLAAAENSSAISEVSSSESGTNSQLTGQARQGEPSTQESPDWFKGAFEYAATAMMIVSRDGRFLLTNDALCRMLGYSKQELLALNFQAITYPDDLTRNVSQLRQILAGELDAFQEEKRYVHKDGQVIWVQINVAAVRDDKGEVLYFVTQVYDITQRQQTEEMLERLRLAVEQSLEGLAMADLDGLVQFVNPAWAAMHGYTVEELAGQSLSLFHTPEQLRTEVEVFNARVLEQGLHQGEMGHKRKDGVTFPTWMSVTQVKDAAGKPIGLLAACQDITGRKQVEAALAKRADELQAVTRISTALSSILDSERLLQEVVDLTKSGFDLYHAHLYLLDEAGEDLVLAAGAGEVGRKMTAQDWRIPLAHEKSLVARTARTRQGVIANDVRAEPDFLPNPDLPETRSEMAVPVMTGEKLLGVLDVQSDQVGRFSEEDVQIMTTLAAQAAIAIQNAHLFAQTQAALDDLSESQSLLRSIIDATPDWIFIKDQEHRYRLANQGYATALHLSPEDFLGKNDLELGFPEELVKGNPEKGIRGFWADDRLVMDSGEPQVYPNDPATIDGQVHVFHTIKTPLRDAEDKVWGVLAFSRDITEREQALIEMQQSQQLLRTVIDATPDWIFIKDQEHRFRLVNLGYANSLRMDPADLVGKTDLDLGFPEDIVKGNPEKGIRGFWPDDREVMDSGKPKFVNSEPAVLDGKPIFLNTIKVPLRDAEDKVWGVLGFVRDVTERETVLAEIQQSQNLLRSIIDATPDWIFIKDQEHRYRLVNQGYANSLHMSPEDFIGKNDLDIGFPEDIIKGNPEKGIRGFWADDREVMDSGNPKFVNSEPGVVDGKPVYLNTIKVPLRDAEDKVWGVLGFVRDVTERETVLAEVEQSRAEAEARLRETQILQQLAQSLSGTLEANEVIDAFFTASRELLGADYAIFSLVDPHQKRIRAVAGFNVSEDHIRRANHPLDSSDIMADIIRSGQTEIISGWDSRFDSENFDKEGMVGWGMRIFSPIILRHENVGMVEVGFKEKVEMTVQETQVRLLRSLVDQTAIAIESAQRYEASQKMAQRERSIREITEKVRQAPNLDLLAKVVAEELGKVLGVSHSLVRVGAGIGATPVTASNGKNGNGPEQVPPGPAGEGVKDV